MSIVQIILVILKVFDSLLNTYRENQWIKSGEDAEIAKVSASILSKTEYARHVREQVAGLDGSAVDKLLHDLEPK